MNLTTIAEVKRPASVDDVDGWRDGYSWLAGGTWLFSEPQVAVDTVIGLDSLGWAPLTAREAGLDIAATCRVVELHEFEGPPGWRAVALFRKCIDSFLMSFKIWNAATIGGNVCMSLPAGAMISLTAALEGVCTLWPRNSEPREVSVVDFVTGNHQNVLQKGELLRKIHLPVAALSKRTAMRQVSLPTLGGSAATPRPVELRFATCPSAEELRHALDARLPPEAYFDDVHGSAPYKRHITQYLAEQMRTELA